jgi:predicted O-linked N-acetylglucosamine transferase (SPINDLY family)
MLNITTGSAEVYKRLGAALYQQGRYDEALNAFRRAAELEPGNAAARHNVGLAIFALKRFDEALPHFRKALELNHRLAIGWNSLAAALLETGQPHEAVVALRSGLIVDPANTAMHSFLLCALAHADAAPDAIIAETAAYAARFPLPPRPPAAAAEHRPLRVGYVSADFRDHAVVHFLEPLLRHQPPTTVETFAYSHTPAPDVVTARLQSLVTGWRDITALTNEQAAAQIRADRIDILIDLMGHTAGNRLPLFALRPAPVQVSWLGYAGPTPLPAIDATLSDPLLWPTDAPLPVLAPYAPPPHLPELTAGPHPLTLASLGNPVKLSAPTLAAWARLLEELPAARLLLLVPALDPAALARIRSHFPAALHPRLDFRDKLPFAGYLALHQEIDILLDTFPLSGHTVSCHALAMGVPIVTRAGATPWQRLTASVLAALDKPDWIATTPDDYIRRAVALAQHLPDRARLRREFLSSPLTDASAFAAAFTQTLRGLHERSLAAP